MSGPLFYRAPGAAGSFGGRTAGARRKPHPATVSHARAYLFFRTGAPSPCAGRVFGRNFSGRTGRLLPNAGVVMAPSAIRLFQLSGPVLCGRSSPEAPLCGVRKAPCTAEHVRKAGFFLCPKGFPGRLHAFSLFGMKNLPPGSPGGDLLKERLQVCCKSFLFIL